MHLCFFLHFYAILFLECSLQLKNRICGCGLETRKTPRSRVEELEVKLTTLQRALELDSAAAADIGPAAPHALPRERAADNNESACCGRQSVVSPNPNSDSTAVNLKL